MKGQRALKTHLVFVDIFGGLPWPFILKDVFLFNCVFCVLIVKGCCHRARTSSDSLQKRNFSPKWSKLGVAIEYPNLATNTAIFPTKFGCTHEILVFFQHHVEKNIKQHIAPNTVSRRTTTASSRSQWALPDLSQTPQRMSDRMPERM